MSAIKLTLTSDKQTSLSNTSHNLFTVAFDADGNASWTTIYASGFQSTTATIPLMDSGKLYVIETAAPLNTLQGIITKQSDISVLNATSTTTSQFRYDSFEYALSPADEGGTPQGNLTSVEGFGFPMSITVDYTNQPDATVGYNISASSLIAQLGTAGSPQFNFTTGGAYLYSGSPSVVKWILSSRQKV
jgi:hypothetical protein